MKTEKEIRKTIENIETTNVLTEVVMSHKQKARVRIVVKTLKWVLEENQE